MELYGYEFIRESDLAHYGIKGQKWGIRRFQNDDGTWTEAGQERYGGSVGGSVHRALAGVYNLNARTYTRLGNKALASMNVAAKNQQLKKANAADQAKAAKMAEKAKREAERKTRRIKKTQHRANMKRAPYLNANDRSKNVFLDKMGGRKINADYTTRKNRGEALVARNRSRIGAVGRHFGRGIIAGAGLTGISLLANMSLSGSGAAAANTVLRGVGTAVTVSSLIRTYQDISDINTYRDAKVRGK